MTTFFAIMLSVLAVTAAIMLAIFVLAPALKGLRWLIVHVFAFVVGMVSSVLRAAGGLLTLVVLVPLILLNIVIGRWSAAAHFGRSVQDELATVGRSLYRCVIGHPARFLLLTPLIEGLEQRVPEAVAHAPGSDKPSKRTGQFDGYTIIGSLRGGGSGGRLYIAEPDERKRAAFARRGVVADQVVIKTFSLADGSSLPQIVRENRSLDAARKMGLVLEHDLTERRFYYVMPYVPGETLSVITQRLHEQCDAGGLRGEALLCAIGYGIDLVRTLDTYHRGGLWHKDVKPDNIIISEGSAHLVDFGLVTPLRSAMTLTTHGTEYFRDPEMVRMALRGVKVHEVNGAKFDIYAAGAVLYSMIERSFPAHGGLSQISKRCPEALRWIVRRAMAEYDNRYETSREMLEDLRAVHGASDAFALKPADLPSMRGGRVASYVDDEAAVARAHEEAREFARSPRPRDEGAARAAPAAFAGGAPGVGGVRGRPQLRVTNWVRGSYVVEGDAAGAGGRRAPGRRGGSGRSAKDQLASARARVDAARRRAAGRRGATARARGWKQERFDTRPNAGVAVAFVVFLGVCVLGAMAITSGALLWPSQRGARAHNDAARSHVDDAMISAEEAVMRAIGGLDPAALRGVRLLGGARSPVALPAGLSGQWLVLDDFVGSVSPDARAAIDTLVSGIGLLGVEVRGLGDTEEELSLVAAARAALGATPPDSTDAHDRLEQWLNETPDLSGLVWFARGADVTRPEIVLVTRDGTGVAHARRVGND